MDTIRIISDYYLNATGKLLTRSAPQKDVELAITRATVGMEFKARWTRDPKKQEKFVQIWNQLKKENYGTVCGRIKID